MTSYEKVFKALDKLRAAMREEAAAKEILDAAEKALVAAKDAHRIAGTFVLDAERLVKTMCDEAARAEGGK